MVPVAIGDSNDAAIIHGFHNLDDFSLMSIFDLLPIDDLIRIAQLSPRFKKLIFDHYLKHKHNIHKREIHISVWERFSMYYQYDDSSKFTYFATTNNVLPTLKIIGQLLGKITIQITPEGFENIEQLQFYINTYCTNAVQTVSLKQYGEHKLGDVKVSFLNATNVILHHNHFEDIPPLRLDEAFPRMQKLHIGRDAELQHHNPYLTELVFDKLWRIRSQPDFLRYLRLNPQLRHIEVPCLHNDTFLSSISEAIPNLESLSIRLLNSEYSDETFQIARFRHVKRFTLKQDLFSQVNLMSAEALELVDSIQFDRLESFSVLDQTLDSRGPIIEIILKNAALQHLMINSEFSESQVSTLITSLTELKAITIIWVHKTVHSRFGEYLRHANRNNALEKFTVSFAEKSPTTYKDLLPYASRHGWTRRSAVDLEDPTWLYLERSL